MSTIIESLNWRYACKKFDASKKLTDEQANLLLESMRLTASSYGLQPWKFVVVKNEELREKLVAASWNQAQVKDASHLFVLCAPLKVDEAFVDNYLQTQADIREQNVEDLAGFKKMLMMIANMDDEKQKAWAKNQIYIALGTLLTTCADMKIDSCPMEGFKAKEYDEILGLEKLGLRSVVVCPVGYRAEDDKYAGLAKVRDSFDNLVIEL